MMDEVMSPFTRDVLKGPILAEFEMPQIKPYSGEGDPTEHLEFFRSWMEMQGASGAVMCRAVSLTLTGVAQNWFMKLKPSSMSSFTQLSKSFITQFVGTAEVDSPFTREVLEVPIPPNFNMPLMEAYSDEGDPTDHLENFSFMDGAVCCVIRSNYVSSFLIDLDWCSSKVVQDVKTWVYRFFYSARQVIITQFMIVAEVESPFTRKVREVPLPPNYKMPQVKVYNAEGDPREHLITFNSWMELYAVSDAIKCRAFSLTLAGGAREWFRRLRPGSISSFTQLSKTFTSQFMKEAYLKKSFFHLYLVKQGGGK